MMNVVRRLRLALHARAVRYLARVTWVEGTLDGCDEPFRCLFAGDSQLQPYLIRRMYNGEPRVIARRRVRIASLPRLVRQNTLAVDLCVAVLPPATRDLFAGFLAFRGQEFVCQVVDLPASWEAMTSRLHRTPRGTGRLIRKHGLTRRISHDARDFDFFYRRMFVPHTQNQYGPLAIIETFDEMKTFFDRGFLLLVEEAGHPIAGSLCLMDDAVLTYRRMGVLDADDAHIRKGAQMAVYYFSLQLALERGLRAFDLMKSRALLEDGVYEHKRKWGATTLPDPESESWVHFVCPRPGERVARVFARHPVIVHAGAGLRGLVGVDPGVALTPEVKAELLERYDAPGLDGLIVLGSTSHGDPVWVDRISQEPIQP